jgi:hypothetical protein
MMDNDSPHRLVPLDTLEDLKRVLFVQETIAQEVRREMMATATTEELAKGKLSGPEEVKRIVLAHGRLLEKYAKYPTLSEFSFHPSLVGATKWGATFGVAIMVRALVIDQVRISLLKNIPFRPFLPYIRSIHLLVLKELDNPTHEYLIEPLEEALKVSVTVEGAGTKVEATDEQGRQFTRRLLYQLVERLLLSSAQYSIVMQVPMGFAITDTGRRVLLHLTDADIFLKELVEAHRRFQGERPKLSLL